MWTGSLGSGWGPVAGCFEQDNEFSASTKGEVFDQLSNYQIFTMIFYTMDLASQLLSMCLYLNTKINVQTNQKWVLITN